MQATAEIRSFSQKNRNDADFVIGSKTSLTNSHNVCYTHIKSVIPALLLISLALGANRSFFPLPVPGDRPQHIPRTSAARKNRQTYRWSEFGGTTPAHRKAPALCGSLWRERGRSNRRILFRWRAPDPP